MKQANEIIINATLLTEQLQAPFYEFVLNAGLEVIECGCIPSLLDNQLSVVANPAVSLYGQLFELNHVRINPKFDNTLILSRLAKALEESGVKITHPPHPHDMQLCFKPLGELSDTVRFYVNPQSHLIFLSSSVQLKLVSGQH